MSRYTNIPDEIIEEIRDKVSLTSVLEACVARTPGRLELPARLPKRPGSHYKMCCPFHQERTASFNVNEKRRTYHCFGCQAHGDVYSLAKELGLADNFPEAVRFVASLSDATRSLVDGPRQPLSPLVRDVETEFNPNVTYRNDLLRVLD